jgi:hypothetical protein
MKWEIKDKGLSLGQQAALKMTVQYIGKFNRVYFANLFGSYIPCREEILCLWN